MKSEKSNELFNRARKVIPGGVNSPVRAFRSVGMNPPFIKRASGSSIFDEDGNEYIDYVCSWGPMILGHANPLVIEEIIEAASFGTSYGAPTEKEVILAEMICEAVPSVEMVRLVSSGTEAVMSALRVARAYTKRDMIVKFEGCYHGHADSMLVKAGSGALTNGIPDSAGVPKEFAQNTINVPFNNEDVLTSIFENNHDKIAAIIVEPVPANMGLVMPKLGFLKFLREITQKYGALLIFDEVITGFRVSYSGAGGYFDILPDISTFGKIIGGGLPVGAYGGKREIMSMIAPVGNVYQAGTLSGNPVAVAAGIRTLQLLRDNPHIYHELDEKADFLARGLRKISEKCGVLTQISRIGSLIGMFFNENQVMDYQTAILSDNNKFTTYFKTMVENGIYLAPSQFEVMFISHAHSNSDIEKTLMIAEFAMNKIARKE